MNKTFTVNIAGLVFHIEEQAYHQLNQYLEAIKQSITAEEREEIIHDIELRIAELFSQKINEYNQVIVTKDVEEVIQIMGKPEDYNIDDQVPPTNEESDQYYTFPKVKKLYRDPENGKVGGVLAGLGHYFNIEVLWLRVLFLILLFTFGSGFLFYIILWIVVPKAKTTTQILEMRGEPINISSIEKKVSESLQEVTDKINKLDYEKLKNSTKNTANQTWNILKRIFGIILISVAIMGFLTIAFLMIYIFKNINTELIANEILTTYLIDNNQGSFGLNFTALAAVAILPFIIIFLISLKLLYSNMKYIGVLSISLITLWIASTFYLALNITDIKNAEKIQYLIDEESVMRETISFPVELDTLSLKMVNPKYFENTDQDYTAFEQNNQLDPLNLKIEFSDSDQQHTYAQLKTEYKHNELLRNTPSNEPLQVPQLQYKTIENTLILSNAIVFPNLEKSTQSKAKLEIYVPSNKVIYIPDALKKYIDDENKNILGNHYYIFKNDELKCLDCQ